MLQKQNGDSLNSQAASGLFNREHRCHKPFHSPFLCCATLSLAEGFLVHLPVKFHLTDASEGCVTHPAPQTPNSGCQKEIKIITTVQRGEG